MIARLVLISLTALCLIAYLGQCLYLYLEQDRMIFHPDPITEKDLATIQARWPVTPFFLDTSIGTIQGYFICRRPGLPLVVYFGGNALEVSHMIPRFMPFKEVNVVLWNYPGYGLSKGTPSQKAILHSALSVMDHFLKDGHLRPTATYLVGRSLGSAVALYVASRRKVERLMLITPFSSLLDLARDQYPWMPVGWLLRHRFEAESWARGLHVGRVAVVLADRDSVVPQRYVLKLVGAFPTPPQVYRLPCGHGDVLDAPGFMNALRAFWEG